MHVICTSCSRCKTSKQNARHNSFQPTSYALSYSTTRYMVCYYSIGARQDKTTYRCFQVQVLDQKTKKKKKKPSWRLTLHRIGARDNHRHRGWTLSSFSSASASSPSHHHHSDSSDSGLNSPDASRSRGRGRGRVRGRNGSSKGSLEAVAVVVDVDVEYEEG